MMQIPGAQGNVDVASAAVQEAQRQLDLARAAYEAFDETLYGVAEAELAVAAASDLVDSIEAQVTATTERYDAVLQSLQDQLYQVTTQYDQNQRLKAISKAMSTELLTAEERERLEMEKKSIEIEQQIRATEAARDAELDSLKAQLADAKTSEKAAKDHLEAMNKQAEAAKKILDLQVQSSEKALAAAKATEDAAKIDLDAAEAKAEIIKSQIELLIEQNNLLREQAKLKAESETTEAEKQPYTPPEIGATEDFTKLIEQAQKDAELAAQGFMDSLNELGKMWEKSGVGTAFDNFRGAISSLGTAIADFLGIGGGVVNPGDPPHARYTESPLTALKNAWKEIGEWLIPPPGETFIENFANQLKTHAPIIYIMAAILVGAGLMLWNGSIWIYSFAKRMAESPLGQAFGKEMADFSKGGSDFLVGILYILGGVALVVAKAADILLSSTLLGTIGKVVLGLGAIALAPITLPLITLALGLQNFTQTIVAIGPMLRDFGKDFYEGCKSIADALDLLNKGDTKGMLGKLADAFQIMSGTNPGEASGGGILSWLAKVLRGWSGEGTAGVRARGGGVNAGLDYLVGENGPEIYSPSQNGVIFPTIMSMFARMAAQPVAAAPAWGGGGVSNSYNIEINPTYNKVQSEAGIYYDVIAALGAVYR